MQRADARLLNGNTRSSQQRESQQLQFNINAHRAIEVYLE